MAPQKPEITIALDVPDAAVIGRIVDALPSAIQWYKVGLELFCAAGPQALQPLQQRGKCIFLDLKLHDIPRTVERAVRAVAAQGVQMLTVHAGGGRTMLETAAKAARDLGPNAPKLVAVTALTSLNQDDLADLGVVRPLAEHVRALAHLALEAGLDGLVCSPLEAAQLRQVLGSAPLLITPGIRSTADPMGDQRRTATAAEAVRAGASHLVVGRPVLDAPDPRAAAERLLREANAAFAERTAP